MLDLRHKTLTTVKTFLFFSTFFLLMTSCKKDKLTGDSKTLSGTWQWVKTSGEFSTLTPDNTGTTKTLEFIDKGKYEIKKDGKRLEDGRITYSEGSNSFGNYIKLKFLRNNLFSKKSEFPGQSLLQIIHTDTLYIGENIEWTHQPYHLYVRQK
ncbi:MAG TPA: hypothetical protein DCF44_03900 [Chitinophagaceae bacterium]|nr:hypothetical protein [Chitinophagaceae bacterium]